MSWPGHARDDLRGLDLLEHLDLVAQARRLLEREPRRRLLHATAEVLDHLVVATVEHLDRVGNVLRIGLGRDQADARARAAVDLVLQARARTVREERVLARPQPEELLQQQQRLARRGGARVRTEEAARQLPRAAIERDARILVARHVDEREALVVLEQHVVARLVLLDQVVLEQQRLGLRRRDRHLDAPDLGEHRERPVARARGRGSSSRRGS